MFFKVWHVFALYYTNKAVLHRSLARKIRKKLKVMCFILIILIVRGFSLWLIYKIKKNQRRNLDRQTAKISTTD